MEGALSDEPVSYEACTAAGPRAAGGAVKERIHLLRDAPKKLSPVLLDSTALIVVRGWRRVLRSYGVLSGIDAGVGGELWSGWSAAITNFFFTGSNLSRVRLAQNQENTSFLSPTNSVNR
jgi:hypothetical protein